MDIINKYDTQLDAYVLDQMKPAEKLAFESLLNAHQELKDELGMRKALHLGLEQIELGDIRSRLKTISKNRISHHDENKQVAKDKSSSKGLKFLLLLGLIATLVFIASRFMQKTEMPIKNNNIMIADYYEAMPLQVSDRGEVNQEYQEFIDLYNKKEYTAAIPLLNNLIKEKPDVKWNLYRGIAYYESDDFVKANEDFKTLANSDNYYLVDHGIWYQALTALKTGDNETAKRLLTSLVNKPKADHVKEAKEILSQL